MDGKTPDNKVIYNKKKLAIRLHNWFSESQTNETTPTMCYLSQERLLLIIYLFIMKKIKTKEILLDSLNIGLVDIAKQTDQFRYLAEGNSREFTLWYLSNQVWQQVYKFCGNCKCIVPWKTILISKPQQYEENN